jgi:hypothetical protein
MRQRARISVLNEIGEDKTAAMNMRVTYPDGSTEIIVGATRVDQQNFHEGMYDFYDERGTLLRQIDMGSGIKWETTDNANE